MLRDQNGSVTVIAALMIIMGLSVAAFAIDLANLQTAQLTLQRITDAAAFAGATRPDAAKDGVVGPEARATAASILKLNAVDSATMTIDLQKGEEGDNNLVVGASRHVPLLFGQFLGAAPGYRVGASSGVRIGGGGSTSGECLRSMVGPTNIYGSAQVRGRGCLAGAATYLHLCGSAGLDVEKVTVSYSQASQRPYICGTANLAPALSSFGFDTPSVDPFAGDDRIKAIRARLDRMRSPGWPYGSASPGDPIRRSAPTGAVSVRYTNQSPTTAIATSVAYSGLALDSSTVRFADSGSDPGCSRPTTFSAPVDLRGRTTIHLPPGCYVFGSSFTVAAGADIEIVTGPPGDDPAGTPSVTLVFNGSIANSGSIRFGAAKVTVAGSINNSAGTLLRFGAGEFVLAGGSVSNGPGRFEKGDGTFYAKGGSFSNDAGTMTFGNGTFYLWGGSLANASTGAVRFGNGPFIFYGGTVTNVSGEMAFGRGPFEFHGGSLALSRTSRTTFGVGDLNFYGGSASFGGEKVVFGAGGSAESGGSSIFLSGGSLALPASSIEAIGTTIAFHGGTISLYGNGHINAVAPMGTRPAFGYRDILFVVYGGAFNLYEGSGRPNIMSGLIYVPRTNASIYGRQAVERPPGGCLQLLAGVVDIYQNAKLDLAACNESRRQASAKPVLVR